MPTKHPGGLTPLPTGGETAYIYANRRLEHVRETQPSDTNHAGGNVLGKPGGGCRPCSRIAGAKIEAARHRACHGAHAGLKIAAGRHRQAAAYAGSAGRGDTDAGIARDGGSAAAGDDDCHAKVAAHLPAELCCAGGEVGAALADGLGACGGVGEVCGDVGKGEVDIRNVGHSRSLRTRRYEAGRGGACTDGISGAAGRVVVRIKGTSLAVLAAYTTEGNALVCAAKEIGDASLSPYERLGSLGREIGLLYSEDG